MPLGAVSHLRADSDAGQCQFARFRPAAPITLHTERMTDTLHDHSGDGEASRALTPWEHWEEHDGQPVIVWNEELHAAWLERSAPRCPDGSPP
jgi:hypothetical protein